LPIHRVVRVPSDTFDPIQFEGSLYNHFDVKDFPFKKANEKRVRARLLKELAKHRGTKHAFGIYLGGNKYLLATLKDEKLIEEIITENKPKAWKKLDVPILHAFIIDLLLGIKRGSPEAESNIKYIKNEEEGINLVNSKKYQAAIFLNPTSVNDIVQIAGKYEKMPQKSTFFYPKLLSGMVMYKIDLKEKIKE
jgi:uncharacterized protein (DUF1015 family)